MSPESDDARATPKVDDRLSTDLVSNAEIEVGLRGRIPRILTLGTGEGL